MHGLEDVEVIVQTAVVVLVEYLHPDERVEDNGGEHLLRLFLPEVSADDFVSGKVEHEGYGELVDGLAQDHLPHCYREERGFLWRGFAVEDFLRWWIRCAVVC